MNSKQFIKLFAITLCHLHTQWFSTERLISHQRKKLRKILAHAFMHVPFYRDISQQLKINVHEISSISDLKSLPAVTKETIQEDPQRFLSLIGNRKLWFSSKSSGSTGEPVQVYFDPYCWLTSRYALKLRSLYAMGFPVWGKIVVVRIVESQILQDQW